MSHGGGGARKMPKKCHILFEWTLKSYGFCLVCLMVKPTLGMTSCLNQLNGQPYLQYSYRKVQRNAMYLTFESPTSSRELVGSKD